MSFHGSDSFFLAIFCYVTVTWNGKKNRPKTHWDRKKSEKFRMPREWMNRKYFLGPLNGHVFSPYFRVSERSEQFFASQHRTL